MSYNARQDMIGNLEIKSRPIRLGFIVDPRSIRSIAQAVELSSSLWGGAHNPLIPLYGYTPKNWEHPFRPPSPQSIVQGYIDAFDPDILVQCTPKLPEYVKNIGLEIIKPADIWEPLSRDSLSPKYGIGIFELFSKIYEEHFRYKERYSLKVALPKFPQQYTLFWKSLYGSLPKKVIESINPRWKKALEITTPKANASNLKQLLRGNVLFPRRITQHELDYFNRSGYRNNAYVFFMDATKPLDIIDFWNLRALGRQVIPVPIQFKDEQPLKDIVSDFVVGAHRQSRHNPQIYYYAAFVRSRNTTMDDMTAYAKNLNITPNPLNEPAYSLQHWYPRIWDDWARDKDSAEADEIFHEKKNIDLNESSDKPLIMLNAVKPPFIFDEFFYQEPRLANEIEFNLYGTGDLFPQVFPQNGKDNLIRNAVGSMIAHRHEWRISRGKLVKLIADDFTDRWEIPLAQNIFTGWMKDLGWKIDLSTPGLLARQIYKQLDGSLKTLANEKLLKLFEHMNSGNENEREMSVADVISQLRQIRGNDHLYDFLIERNVFRVGAKVQCPNCKRNSWYSLDNLKESLTCPRCLNNFSAVGNLENSGAWFYKTTGPFSVPCYADGAYCVLLAISFFDHDLHHLKITPAYSFTGQDDTGHNLEADFGVLWQESSYRGVSEGVLFGESKTFGPFKQADFQRMRKIAKRFPGAVIAFCTLRPDLTTYEKRELTKLAKVGRKSLRSEVPVNPVMILTATELLGDEGVPYCWKDRSDYKKFEHMFGILEIANATQQIYLGLPPWEEEWHKEYEAKRKKRQAKAKP